MVNKLLEFFHDRNAYFPDSCRDLMKAIDCFADQKEMKEFYSYFEKHYGIPVSVTKQQIKKYTELSYNYRQAKFDKKLSLDTLSKAQGLHLGFLGYVFFHGRALPKEIKRYELMIEGVVTPIELKRFDQMIKEFGRENVLVVATRNLDAANLNFHWAQEYKNFDRKEVWAAMRKEIRYGILFYRRLSKDINLNVFPLATHIIKQYLYYKTLFKQFRAEYCLQERHYQTNPIKNWLFHQYEGKNSATLQKNIYCIGSMGFYFDIDTFFSLGNRAMERAVEFGANIKEIVPVGSYAMQHFWFGQKRNQDAVKEFDVLYLGVNYNSTNRIEAYSAFDRDYYEAIDWLVRLSGDHPELKIAIAHHVSYRGDPREEGMIAKTNIQYLPKEENSYALAFKAKCPVSTLTTMGYELIAHGKPMLYMDPHRSNIQVLPETDLIDPWRMTSYESFRDHVLRIVKGEFEQPRDYAYADICCDSEFVAKKVRAVFRGEHELIGQEIRADGKT